jgi:hypothetical protein
MPQDVPMGQGYMGDALLAAFPGQYRGGDPAPTSPVNYLPQPPGAAAGRPSYSDPDSGRRLALVEMPGVGQVVVPVEHTMVGMNQVVVPVEHTMVGVDAIACGVDRENLSGLGHHQVCAWGVGKISKAAGAAAHEVLALIKSGQIKTAGEAQAHIKASTAKVGSRVTTRLQGRIAKIPSVVDQAASQAWAAVKSQVEAALSGSQRMGHHPQEDLSGMDAIIWGKQRAPSWVNDLAAAARKGAQDALQLAQTGPISGMAFKASALPGQNAIQLLTYYVTRAVQAFIAATVHRGAPPTNVVKQVIADTVSAWVPKVQAALAKIRGVVVPSPTGPVRMPAPPPLAVREAGVRGGL